MKHLLLMVTIVVGYNIQLHAQTTTAKVPITTAVVKPAALNMKAYKLTAAYAQRQKIYSPSFTNPSKVFAMDNNCKLHITFQKNPSWAGMSNQITDSKSAAAPVHGSTAPSGWTCQTSNVTINAQSTNFGLADYSLQSSHIYPGAIYTFDHFMDGSFTPQAGTRNPIIISTDNPNITGDNFVQVNNPGQSTIQNGVSALYSRFSGSSGNGSTTDQLYESYNTSDWTLKVTAGGSGYGASFNNVFNATNQSQHRYLTIDAEKTLYTIYTTPPANGFFTDVSVEATPNLMVVGAVTYGVRILANLEITFNSSSDANDFNAKYDGESYKGNFDLNYLQNNSSLQTNINGYVIGGPNTGIVSFTKDQLVSYINNVLAGANYQNARPISYQFYDMAGDVIGAQSATDQFVYQTCVPAPNPPTLKSVVVNVQCGPDGKDNDTHYAYDLYNSAGTDVASYTNNSNSSQFADNSTNNTNQLTVSGSHTLNEFATGGQFRITITPNGNDTWKIANMTVTLTFSDGTSTQALPVRWNNLVLSQSNKVGNYYFSYTGGSFQAQ